MGELALYTLPEGQEMVHSPLNDLIDNFYQTDSISRASLNMTKCSVAFNPQKFSNFKQNVHLF